MSLQKIYARRMSFIFIIFFGLFFTVLVYLYHLQIRSHVFFAGLASRQYYGTVRNMPERSPILDCTGKYLALNKRSLSLFLVPAQLHDPKSVKDFLAKHFPGAYQRLLEKPHAQFMYIKRHISEQEKNVVQQAEIDDIKFLQEPYRFYTVPSFGLLVGKTDSDNCGILGLELMHNELLAGKPIVYMLEKDARSGHFYFEKEAATSGCDGKKINTTLDASLQTIVALSLRDYVKKIDAIEGSVLIMDAKTGALDALSFVPDFDPNHVSLDHSEQSKCKPITDVYEPGSVIKVFLALAALAEGVVQPDEVIDCENKRETRVNKRRVTTWRAHGNLPFSSVIKKSNNIGTSKVALRLGEKLYDHYRRCGFGEKTGIDFLGEQAGFVNCPNKWSKDSVLSLSYGYEISVTLIQLARAFALISNGGYLVDPHIVQKDSTLKNYDVLYEQKTLDQLKDIIAMQWPGMDHVRVMGKTGTANVLTNGAYNSRINVYTFCACIECGDYKKVIVVYIKNNVKGRIYAAQVALPLAKKIVQRMLVHNKIVPVL